MKNLNKCRNNLDIKRAGIFVCHVILRSFQSPHSTCPTIFSPGHRVSNWTCNRSVRRHPFHHIGSFRCHVKFKYLHLGDHQFHHKHHFHVIWKLATKQPVTSHTVQRWFHQSSLSIFRHSRHDNTEPFVSFGKLRISWIQSDPWVELLLVK